MRSLPIAALLASCAITGASAVPVATLVGNASSASSVTSLQTANFTSTAPAGVAIICSAEVASAASAYVFTDSASNSGWVTATTITQSGVGHYILGYNLNPASALNSGSGWVKISWTGARTESYISCSSVTGISAFDAIGTATSQGAGTAVTAPVYTYTSNLEYSVDVGTDAAHLTTASTYTNGSVQRDAIDNATNGVFFVSDNNVSGHSGGSFGWGWTYSGSTNRFSANLGNFTATVGGADQGDLGSLTGVTQ